MGAMIDAPAHELAESLHRGDVTAVEVVTAHLARIEAVNPTLHAIVQRSDSALNDAAAADARRRRGDPLGPLHGVPFTVKDWIETAGLVCAAGFEARRAFVPQRDATVVARLRAAGAILLGKSKPGSMTDIHPAPRNPYDISRTPGASSSGGAAVVAACGSPFDIGSDSGGSIRWPAHCCGVAGFKPTSGSVPSTGHFPRVIAMTDPRTTIGPLARSVDDLALIWRVIAGVDWRDASVVPVPTGDHTRVDVAALRVVELEPLPDAPLEPAIAATMNDVARALGGTARRAPARIDEALAITKDYWSRPESTSLESWRPSRRSTLDADAVERHLFEWDRLRRAFARFMEDVDLIVAPVATSGAPAREQAVPEDFVYTLPWSLVGYPCVVVRAGMSTEGLPIGVQLIARPWQDHVALAAARFIEKEFGGWRAPPL
jgi:amidase